MGSLVWFRFPVHQRTKEARLQAAKAEFAPLKRSIGPLLFIQLPNLMMKLGMNSLLMKSWDKACRAGSFVYSNVRGPADQVYIGGEPIVDVKVWFANNLPMFLFTTYNGFLT